MNPLFSASRGSRVVWLDLLKFIALFMMLAVHCTDNVTPAQRSEPWYNLWGSIYGSFMRPAIPLFVMATGALLLPLNQDFPTFCRRRVLRLAIPFLIWSALYNLIPWLTGLLGFDSSAVNLFFVWGDPSQSFGDSMRHLALIPFEFSDYAIQMWYVYLLLGLYLYMPVFSAWVRQASLRAKRLFLLVWGVSLFVPYLREYLTDRLWGECSWNEFGMLYYFAGFNGYLLLGHYLVAHPPTWRGWRFSLGLAAAFVVGYLVTFSGFKHITAIPGESPERVELFFTYCSPNVLLMSVAWFLAVQRWRCPSPVLSRILRDVSESTFGIWMSHYLFLGPCYAVVASLPLPVMCKILLCTLSLLAVTWLFVAAVRRSGRVGEVVMGVRSV